MPFYQVQTPTLLKVMEDAVFCPHISQRILFSQKFVFCLFSWLCFEMFISVSPDILFMALLSRAWGKKLFSRWIDNQGKKKPSYFPWLGLLPGFCLALDSYLYCSSTLSTWRTSVIYSIKTKWLALSTALMMSVIVWSSDRLVYSH